MGVVTVVPQTLILDLKCVMMAAVHLRAWRINEYGRGVGAWEECRVVARCTFTTRKLTTFVMGRGKLDTMVNDCDGGE